MFLEYSSLCIQLHHRNAERAYQQLKEDAALSQSSQQVDVFTFDLQQSLAHTKTWYKYCILQKANVDVQLWDS